MNETCMNHALNMPNINSCPYCEIDRLKIKLSNALLANEGCREKYKVVCDKLTDVRTKLRNLTQ